MATVVAGIAETTTKMRPLRTLGATTTSRHGSQQSVGSRHGISRGESGQMPQILDGISGNYLKIQLVFPTRYPVSQGISTDLAS